MAEFLGTQARGEFNYNALKSGDVTPDGLIFVSPYKNPQTQGWEFLLRTKFNYISYHEAEGQLEVEKARGLYLPTCDQLCTIGRAMSEEEISEMGDNSFAWSSEPANFSEEHLRDYMRGICLAEAYHKPRISVRLCHSPDLNSYVERLLYHCPDYTSFASTGCDRKSRYGQVCFVRTVDYT